MSSMPQTARRRPLYSKLETKEPAPPPRSIPSLANSNSSAESYESSSPLEIDVCTVRTLQDCQQQQQRQVVTATQSKLAATTNLTKCICGAGSFALPHVFLEQGVLGGTLSLTLCGALAARTMTSLADSKQKQLQQMDAGNGASFCCSYVWLAGRTLGPHAGQLVFVLTLTAALGVCSTYLVFIGQTLESMAVLDEPNNWLSLYFANVPMVKWEVGTALVLVPLCCIRDYSMFAFTSAVGVLAVVGGMMVTLASGVWVEPGLQVALQNVPELRWWPESLAQAFGRSFGTIAYLFCINFLTFPIMNSMREPEEYSEAVHWAVAVVWLFNVVFATGCLAFYGDDTQDLVLQNLGNGPYLSALKLFLCVDLLFTFPIVFSSGRQILEDALLPQTDAQRAMLVTAAVGACLGLAQVGGFGAVANLVGGVAQGTLAFLLPPAIAVTLARRADSRESETGQWALAAFGVLVVLAVTYFTLESILVAP